MEVGILFKIGAVGILVSVLCQVLKHSGREEQAFLASLAGLVLVLFWILPYISALFEDIKQLFSKAGICPSCDGRCRPLHSCRDRRKNAVSARHARTNEIVSPGGLIVSEYAAENAWDHVCGAVFRRDL